MAQNPPVINIRMVPAGVELVLAALNQMPRAQVDGLWREIADQYTGQVKALQGELQLEAAAEVAEESAGLNE